MAISVPSQGDSSVCTWHHPPSPALNGTGINPDLASRLLKPKRHFSKVCLLGDQRAAQRGSHGHLLAKGSAWAGGRSSLVGSRAPRAAQLGALRLSPAGARAGCRRLLPVQTFLSSSSSRPPHELLGAQRPGSPPLALPRGRRVPRRRPHPALSAGRRLKPMAEAGRRSVEPLGGPAGPAAAEAPEPQEPAPRPATALRRLPGDPSPRGRSQSDLSSCSSRGRPLRVHISGSVDGLDKASLANSDGPTAGSQTPPFKRKGKLSTIGKIFKPWKWRKKKTSDKFRETSAVLERKISTRQSREELIRRGVLKELPDQDGDVTVNFENSNGHMIPIGEESTREENIVKSEEGNGSVAEKAPPLEEKAEDKKAGSSHSKKTTGSKASASPSTSSTSSRPKASKETLSSKTGTVGITKGKKKTGKQPTSRLASDATTSGMSDLKGEPSEMRVESLKPEQTVPGTEEQTTGKSKSAVPPPPVAPPPSPPAPPLPREEQCTVASDTPVVLVSDGTDLPIPALDTSQLLWTEEPTNRTTVFSGPGLSVSRENAKCFTTKDEPGKVAPPLLTPGLLGESSESFSAPEDEGQREYQTNDSDSDGPVLYTDDDDDEEDEDEDGSGESALASKIRRRDTLAIKLGNRPSKKELEDKNILQRTSEEERQEIRQQIGTKLVRRLSQRPTTEELEQRNILKQKNEEEEQEAKMELKRRLSRKLSLRPTVAELQARRILRFNEYVEVTDSPDYDRRADKPWARLTPADKAAIRKELNEFKSTEMEVHEESRQFTRFHRP
ncbi:phosphatase and actin regulator 2 isoform X2 [Mustela lutreola]|uniref:phosphatase and actin regulator 2 isoform X2 n=1 Tax=Mustela lutreola TaxID=9666 RepID=UPI002796EEE9|nr:phosphatase and actin regulator 2 isoform X2 [Mustela lutreola]